MRNLAHLALGMVAFGPVYAASNDAGIRAAVNAAEKVDNEDSIGGPTTQADLLAAVTAFEALSEDGRTKAIAALRNDEHDAAADALQDPSLRDSIKAMSAVKDPDGSDYNDILGFLDNLDLDDDE